MTVSDSITLTVFPLDVLWLLEFAIYKAISGRVPTYGIMHSCRLYSVALLGDQAASTMIQIPRSHIIVTLN